LQLLRVFLVLLVLYRCSNSGLGLGYFLALSSCFGGFCIALLALLRL
jgi:hypothetical protein